MKRNRWGRVENPETEERKREKSRVKHRRRASLPMYLVLDTPHRKETDVLDEFVCGVNSRVKGKPEDGA